MDALSFFHLHHGRVHSSKVSSVSSIADQVFAGLTDDQMRVRPGPGLNSLVWLVWHMARVEDVGVNLVVAGGRQVLDDGWASRLGIDRTDVGTGMTEEELDAAVDVIAALPARSDALDQDILTLIVQAMRRTADRASGEIYTDGLSNVLSEPEFAESDEARRALKLFEKHSTLQDLMVRTTTNSNIGGLQVLIGGEGEWEELRQCSIVLARYGVPGLATGTLGVLGPMRMSYAKTIPTVRFVAGLLSDLVNDTIAGE